jgi:uncharacterized protein (DUF2252 family)
MVTDVSSSELVHLSRDERIAHGRAARAEATRTSHAALDLLPDRDPLGLLRAQEATRTASLLPIRHGRMASSAFAVFRGAATIMAHDLAPSPRAGLHVQLCGDAHLLNFGGYASPERQLVFGINDFDETLPGPFEWDVKRLATSVEIAGRDRGLTDVERKTAVVAAIRAYRDLMRELAGLPNLAVWYARSEVESLSAALRREHELKDAKTVEKTAQRARTHDKRALAKFIEVVDGAPRLVSEPPLIVPVTEFGEGEALEETIREIFRSYRRTLQPDRRALLESFRFRDLARRVVGIGSVGVRCWILLLAGQDEQDLLFLQLKEAQSSVLEPLLGKSGYANHAQRVVEGQRLSQASSDIFLGWTHADDPDGSPHDSYVRQMRDWKMSVDLTQIEPRGLAIYAQWCGAALARAHARSGDRVAIAAYLGKSDVFDRAVTEFAAAYADVNEQDHAALVATISDGSVEAVDGV